MIGTIAKYISIQRFVDTEGDYANQTWQIHLQFWRQQNRLFQFLERMREEAKPQGRLVARPGRKLRQRPCSDSRVRRRDFAKMPDNCISIRGIHLAPWLDK